MPELAAHLERVAKELLNELGLSVDGQPFFPEDVQAVAAALAACAREARLEAIKGTIQAFEHEYMNTGEPLSGVARGIRAMCELKFEAERAAGEKGQ